MASQSNCGCTHCQAGISAIAGHAYVQAAPVVARSSSVSHTPGPWKVQREWMVQREHDTPVRGCFIEAPDGARFIAGLSGPDAHLIAAAPELLEALKALWLVSRKFGTEYPLTLESVMGADAHPFVEAIIRAGVVIAKAEGREL